MTGKKRALSSDLKKVDAHIITPEEYDEIPELTDEDFARGDLYHGDKLISRGRPKSDDPKQLVSLRLDAEVLRWFKSTGPGYQARMGEVLKSHMSRKKAAGKKA
ncbi:BrnA antitoxin family protein [Rhodopseudomonas parapalustris]